MARLREFMFERVYLADAARHEADRVERMLGALFAHYAEHPPPAAVPDASPAERVTDYLAGMTDRFAIRSFAELSLPQGF
jgi:dGTPase